MQDRTGLTVFLVRVVFVLFETRRFCKVARFVFPDLFKRELYEEFIYFTHKDNIEQYEQEGSPVKSQLGIAYTDFIQRDEANFKDYEAFLQYVNKKGVISSENNNIIKNE